MLEYPGLGGGGGGGLQGAWLSMIVSVDCPSAKPTGDAVNSWCCWRGRRSHDSLKLRWPATAAVKWHSLLMKNCDGHTSSSLVVRNSFQQGKMCPLCANRLLL